MADIIKVHVYYCKKLKNFRKKFWCLESIFSILGSATLKASHVIEIDLKSNSTNLTKISALSLSYYSCYTKPLKSIFLATCLLSRLIDLFCNEILYNLSCQNIIGMNNKGNFVNGLAIHNINLKSYFTYGKATLGLITYFYNWNCVSVH